MRIRPGHHAAGGAGAAASCENAAAWQATTTLGRGSRAGACSAPARPRPRERWPAASPARPRSRSTSAAREADVVIVGAGFAGLTAARELDRKGQSAIVLEARDRVGGRVWNADIGGGEISERGAHLRRPDPGPRDRARRRRSKVADLRHLRHGREPLHRQRQAAAVQRHRRRRLRPARPGDPPRPRPVRHPARRDVEERAGRRAVGGAPTRRRCDAQTLETWSTQNTVNAGLPRPGLDRDPADLRRRAARALAAVRALLHRLVGQREEHRAPSSATSTPAAARRCRASSAARS